MVSRQVLFPSHAGTYGDSSVVGADFEECFSLPQFASDRQGLSVAALVQEMHVQAYGCGAGQKFQRQQVAHHLDVAHRVDVAIEIDVAVHDSVF